MFRQFLILFLFLSFQLSAQVIEIKDDFKGLYIGKEVSYIEDLNAELKFDEILKSSDFQLSESEKLNFGYTDSQYWLKFSVLNSTENNDYVISFDYAVLDKIEFYYQSKDGKWSKKIGGDRVVVDKEFDQRYVVFKLDLPKNNIQNYYVHVETEGSYQLGIEIQNLKSLYENDIVAELSFGVYFGVLAIMILYNFFLFFTIKDKNYLWYVLAILSNLIFFSSISGHSFQYLWNNSPIWGGLYSVPFSMGMLSLFTSLFARDFLQLKRYSKLMFKLTNLFIVLGAIIIIITFILPYSIVGKTAAAINGLTAIVVFTAGIVSYRQGNTSARYYVIAWSAYLLGAFILVLKTFGVLSPNFITVHAVQIGSILEALLLSFALGDKYNLYRKEKYDAQKQLLEVERDAKENLEIKVEERTKELKKQNVIIGLKNKEITDSIKYAKQIQEALLPEKQYFGSFLPNSFVFYKPKDIVSGDFYWCEKVGDKIIFAAVDCTGHGVPGAFMSIVGFNGLNRAITESKTTKAGDVLNNLNKIVMNNLNQESKDVQVRDGMDIALCILDEKSKKLEFSGARNPLYLIRNGELMHVRGDKLSIGEDPDFYYTTHDIEVISGDTIFVFTDGFADQFGGEKGKKMNYPRFRELLIETADLPEKLQSEHIAYSFNKWKGDEEQIDDVCVIGVKI